MTSIVNFFPVILVALGALASFVVEPFIKDENKHKVIPWIASVFVVFGMASFCLVNTGVCHDLYAMDPVRRLLGLAVLLCALEECEGHSHGEDSLTKNTRAVKPTGCCSSPRAVQYS